MATAVVYGDGTDFLTLPAYSGAVASVTAPDGYAVPAYVELEGLLVTVDSEGRRRSSVPNPAYDDRYSTAASPLTWTLGVPYTVTATFTVADATDETLLLELRRMTGEVDGDYEDEVLTAILERYPLDGTFDLNAAAADVWAEKAGAAMADLGTATSGTVKTITDQGTSITYADAGSTTLKADALKMAAYYRALASSASIGPGVW